MKPIIRNSAYLAVLFSLFYPKTTFGNPVSEQQASNTVVRALAIQSAAAINGPIHFNGALLTAQRTVSRVDRVIHAGGLVGFSVSLAPSGYYLISTDDQLPPWKLRSDDGALTNLPPGLLAVLKVEMAEDQQALKDLQRAGKLPRPQFHAQWQTLIGTGDPTNNGSGPPTGAPGVYLLTTTWDQNAPYNYYCPVVSGGPGGRAYAGCTACALSQILRYHTQPQIVAQNHTYTDTLGTHSISDAGMGAYDWANMPGAVSTSSTLAQQEAVGQLMYHAAVGLESDFAANETDAYPANVPNVLQAYFTYTAGDFVYKSPTYTSSQWYAKIAADVDAQQPIFYAMWTPTTGHALVCDGYQNGNEIHLNLGWSGSWNAWYNLDSVNAGGYNWSTHGAVFGIAPPPPTITLVSPATLPPSASPQTITISGFNFNGSDAPIPSSVVIIDPANNTSTKIPVNVTATSMQCSITVQSTGTWKAQVLNGSVESLPYSFSVSSTVPQLTALSVSGPAYIKENGTGQFTATATLTDGSQQTVTSTAIWSENSTATTISSSGLLTAGSVSGDTPVTVSASYTAGGITKSATANVVVAKSASCGTQTYDAIVNGSFADGSSSWTLSGNFQADSRFSTCYSCPGYAYLANADGSGGNNLSGTLSQSVTIPANATSATLGYYYRITTSDSTTIAYDHLLLNLVLPGGSLVGLDDLSNLNANSAYAYRSFDITSYKGQTITVRFTATTDPSGPTVFRVDDVSVVITAQNPVTPVLFGVGGPTNVTEGTTAQYNAIVVNCDGSIQSVTPTWSENSIATSISSSGLLTAGIVSNDTPVTITARYGTFTLNYPITVVNIVPTFSSLAISGPASLNENSSGQFYATAIFSDGTSQSVSPSWSENSDVITISAGGVLTAGEVASDTNVTIVAFYTIAGVTCGASMDVLIKNVPPPITLSSLSITGPSSVNENSTAQYAATASFSDGSTQSVIPIWDDNSPAASISLYGLLSAGEVANDTPLTVTASYTSGGITQNASKSITILTTVLPTLRARLTGNQIVLAWGTNSPGFSIEYATNLSSASWTTNPVTPVIVNGQYTVTNAMSGAAKFYRLKR